MVSSHIHRLRWTCLAVLGAAAVAAVPSSVLGAVGQHTTLASFQQNTRADVYLLPLSGPITNVPPIMATGNGYSYTLSTNNASPITRDPNGVGAQFDGAITRITMTGRPVTAFAGTLRIENSINALIAGTMKITTNTGESFTFPVSAAGTFFGFTATQPFTVVDIDTSPGGGSIYEVIDNMYVGTSGTAAAASDQCADAPTISPISIAQYPFTTVGATAEASPGVCDGANDTGPDVWFRLVSPVEGRVTANTCGCSFDSILRVYANCAAAPLGAQIACNDDFCADSGPMQGRASQVSFRVVAGEDYLIRISGYSGASGSGNLSVSVVPDCRADFNHNGGLEVQDIFDFLNAWFAGCP